MKRNEAAGLALAVCACVIVAATEEVIRPSYAVKSLVKAGCWMGTVVLYALISHRKLEDVIRLHRTKEMKRPAIAALACFLGIFAAFALLKNQLDLPAIRSPLMAKEKLTRENCLSVFAYIIVVNSFLEEAFFRGFVFQLMMDRKTGALVSALLFAVYHIGIVATWFNPLVFALCIIGLAGVGLFLQWLSERSIIGSWLPHAAANTAINLIGALLIFEIL